MRTACDRLPAMSSDRKRLTKALNRTRGDFEFPHGDACLVAERGRHYIYALSDDGAKALAELLPKYDSTPTDDVGAELALLDAEAVAYDLERSRSIMVKRERVPLNTRPLGRAPVSIPDFGR